MRTPSREELIYLAAQSWVGDYSFNTIEKINFLEALRNVMQQAVKEIDDEESSQPFPALIATINKYFLENDWQELVVP